MAKFTCNTLEEFIEKTEVSSLFTEAVTQIWNEINVLFKDGDRKVLAISYNNESENLATDVVNTSGELAFVAARLFYEYDESLDRCMLKVLDANTFETLMYIEYRDLEGNESGEDENDEAEED